MITGRQLYLTHFNRENGNETHCKAGLWHYEGYGVTKKSMSSRYGRTDGTASMTGSNAGFIRNLEAFLG